MSVEPGPRFSKTTTSKGSIYLNEGSSLLSSASSDQAKRLRDESLTLLRNRYHMLAGVDAVDVLKVAISLECCHQEIIELCISIAFPVVILQCRTLINLLASQTTYDDYSDLASNYLDLKYAFVLTRLRECFDWVWNRVFDRWKRDANDADGIDMKTGDLGFNLAQISSMVFSIKDAFTQIDKIAGTTLIDITRNAKRMFAMFETGILGCAAKAQKARTNQGNSIFLSVSYVPLLTVGRGEKISIPVRRYLSSSVMDQWYQSPNSRHRPEDFIRKRSYWYPRSCRSRYEQ